MKKKKEKSTESRRKLEANEWCSKRICFFFLVSYFLRPKDDRLCHDIAHRFNQVWPLPVVFAFIVEEMESAKKKFFLMLQIYDFGKGQTVGLFSSTTINLYVRVCELLSIASTEWSVRHCITTEIKVRIIKRNLFVGSVSSNCVRAYTCV